MAGYVAPGLPNEGGATSEVVGPHGLWLVPVVMVLGGLLVGIITERLAPEAEGHGTDAVIKAFHRNDGRIRARVPFVKLVASAITIGSGGVAGREGPMALITGGLGSWYATLTNRDGRERRLLLLSSACRRGSRRFSALRSAQRWCRGKSCTPTWSSSPALGSLRRSARS